VSAGTHGDARSLVGSACVTDVTDTFTSEKLSWMQ
jgi:hypothetical protein